MAPSYIVTSAFFHRKTAQRHVAVRSAVQHAILSETAVIALEPFMNSPRLIKFCAAALDVENFLNSDHVRIQFSDHGRDAIGIGAPVKSPTFVDVVRSDANSSIHC